MSERDSSVAKLMAFALVVVVATGSVAIAEHERDRANQYKNSYKATASKYAQTLNQHSIPIPVVTVSPVVSIPGVSGRNGSNGAAGKNGHDGSPGVTGARGARGPRGLPGKQGSRGPAGHIGNTGAVGATGAAGPAGATGATGAQGPQGIAGPKGDTGDAGAKGSPGDPPAEFSFTDSTGTKYVCTPNSDSSNDYTCSPQPIVSPSATP